MLAKALGAEAPRREVWERGCSHATARIAVGVNCRCSAQRLCADPFPLHFPSCQQLWDGPKP